MEAGIWEPVGKQSSGLWAGETSNFNDVFMALYRYFETHSEYSFEYLSVWLSPNSHRSERPFASDKLAQD